MLTGATGCQGCVKPPPKWGWTTKQNKGVKLIGRFTLPRKWWDLVLAEHGFFKRDSQSMSTSRFHWEFTFLNWHANLSEWNNSKPPASDHRHGAARLKSCGAFFCRFCGCCARFCGCYGNTFDPSRRGWLDQTGAKDASVAWPKSVDPGFKLVKFGNRNPRSTDRLWVPTTWVSLKIGPFNSDGNFILLLRILSSRHWLGARPNLWCFVLGRPTDAFATIIGLV